MKNVLNDFKKAVIILTIVFTLGLFVPMLISTFVVVFTPTTFESIIYESVVFWIATIICWIIAGTYINESLNKE
jgi:hypothetical protein